MTEKETFARNLQRYMDANGKTRRDVSEDLGISYFTLTDWVKGKRFPRIEKVQLLADYFGIKKTDLIEAAEREKEKTSTPAVRIKEALEVKNMKAAELSSLTGLNKSSISCWLSGEYEPKQDALYRMGKVLDVSEMWLAGYDVPKKEDKTLADINIRMRTDDAFYGFVQQIALLTDAEIEKAQKVLKTIFE